MNEMSGRRWSNCVYVFMCLWETKRQREEREGEMNLKLEAKDCHLHFEGKSRYTTSLLDFLLEFLWGMWVANSVWVLWMLQWIRRCYGNFSFLRRAPTPDICWMLAELLAQDWLYRPNIRSYITFNYIMSLKSWAFLVGFAMKKASTK